MDSWRRVDLTIREVIMIGNWKDHSDDGPDYPLLDEHDTWIFWCGLAIGGAIGLLVGLFLMWVLS